MNLETRTRGVSFAEMGKSASVGVWRGARSVSMAWTEDPKGYGVGVLCGQLRLR